MLIATYFDLLSSYSEGQKSNTTIRITEKVSAKLNQLA